MSINTKQKKKPKKKLRKNQMEKWLWGRGRGNKMEELRRMIKRRLDGEAMEKDARWRRQDKAAKRGGQKSDIAKKKVRVGVRVGRRRATGISAAAGGQTD